MLAKMKSIAQATNILVQWITDAGIEIVPEMASMILDHIPEEDKTSYVERMKRLSLEGYQRYEAFVGSNPQAECGLPEREAVLAYITGCFARNEIPSKEGLCKQAGASGEEAQQLMRYLAFAWSSDPTFFNASRIQECIAQHKALKEAYAHLALRLDAYNKGFGEYIDTHEPMKAPKEGLYEYTCPAVAFLGREAECNQLIDFCNDERELLWWSVVGQGGIGKSRLAYEFSKAMTAKGWRCVFLGKDFFRRMNDIQKWSYPCDLLLIVDYTTYYGQKIGEWIERLHGYRRDGNTKIRILLIERFKPGANQDNDPFASASAPWILEIQKGITDTTLFGGLCFSPRLLVLKPLDEATLCDIAIQVVWEMKQETLSKEMAMKLVSLLCNLDPVLRRPLYLLLLIQMHIDGAAQDPLLNVAKAADYVYGREIKRIQQIMTRDDEEENTIKLLMLSTVTQCTCLDEPGFCSTPLVKEILPSEYASIRFRSKLRRLFGTDDSIVPLTPSLIGESFVLLTLKKYPWLTNSLIQSAWQCNARGTAIFLERVVTDFYEPRKECTFDGVADLDNGIFQKPLADDELTATFYANLLLDLSAVTVSEKDALVAACRLKEYRQTYKASNEILICYAKSLVNLAMRQNAVERIAQTIDVLEWLTYEANVPVEVKIEYARGLYTLGMTIVSHTRIIIPPFPFEAYRQALMDIMLRLRLLWQEEPIYELAIRYIRGLYYIQLQAAFPAGEDEDVEVLREIKRIILMYELTEETKPILEEANEILSWYDEQ